MKIQKGQNLRILGIPPQEQKSVPLVLGTMEEIIFLKHKTNMKTHIQKVDGRVSNPCFFVGDARLHDLWGRSAYRKGGDAVKYAVNTSANDELTLLMEPYMSMQLTTPEMLWQVMQWMQVQFAKLASHRDTSSELRQEWGTPGDVAKIYGCDRTTAARHLIAWAEEGKVRVRLFYDELGDKPGHKRYSLLDVDRCMEENAIRESNRKGKKAA